MSYTPEATDLISDSNVRPRRQRAQSEAKTSAAADEDATGRQGYSSTSLTAQGCCLGQVDLVNEDLLLLRVSKLQNCQRCSWLQEPRRWQDVNHSLNRKSGDAKGSGLRNFYTDR